MHRSLLLAALLTSTACDSGPDDLDGDGSPATEDCDDGDALRSPALSEECGDGIDNDCDALVDCEDADCASAPTCGAEDVCDDGADNDQDGSVDCADLDCLGDPACAPVARVTGGALRWDSSIQRVEDDCSILGFWSSSQTMQATGVHGEVQLGMTGPTCTWQVDSVTGETSVGKHSASTHVEPNFAVQRVGFRLSEGCPLTDSGFLPTRLVRAPAAEGTFGGLSFMLPGADVGGGLWYRGASRTLSWSASTSDYHTSTYNASSVLQSCFVQSMHASGAFAIDALEPSEPFTGQ